MAAAADAVRVRGRRVMTILLEGNTFGHNVIYYNFVILVFRVFQSHPVHLFEALALGNKTTIYPMGPKKQQIVFAYPSKIILFLRSNC